MTRYDVHTTFDTPASPGAGLRPKRNDESGKNWPVREVVGSLLWLSTMMRPDITNGVRAVARYLIDLVEFSHKLMSKIQPVVTR